ncbi:MAG: tetratricopeptide repeat protein [Steroidobacteraceae bacterium]
MSRLLSVLLLCIASLAAHGEVPSEAERQAVYDDFKRAFAAGQMPEALALADQLVRLMEAAKVDNERLSTAWNNLGVVRFRTGDLAGSEASFRRSLELLEATEGIASRRLISPLAGLAAVQAAGDQHALAAESLQRAVAISRRSEGLFNLRQLELLDPLARSFEALGADAQVEQQHRYALKIVQREYGVNDPRTLPATLELARWLEGKGRYVSSRALWGQVVRVGSAEGAGLNVATIDGLVAIARTYRLQYSLDPESIAEANAEDPFAGRYESGTTLPARYIAVRLDDDGEKAALKALELLEASSDPPPEVLARVLMELGDWYTTAHRPELALPYYQRAWPLLAEAEAQGGAANPLSVPLPLHYRPPNAATRNRDRDGVVTEARPLSVELTIAATGEVTAVKVMESTIDESQTNTLVRALGRAWFRPRFDAGEPVEEPAFPYTETWFVIADPAQPPSEASGPESVVEPASEEAGGAGSEVTGS